MAVTRPLSAKSASKLLGPCSGIFDSFRFACRNQQVISCATPLPEDGFPATPKRLAANLSCSQPPFQHGKNTIVTADPTFGCGIDNLDFIETQGIELLAILQRT